MGMLTNKIHKKRMPTKVILKKKMLEISLLHLKQRQEQGDQREYVIARDADTVEAGDITVLLETIDIAQIGAGAT